MNGLNASASLQPLGSRVLVKPLDQDNRTASGIFLPETAKEKPQLGQVVAVGDDEEIKVKVGDKVVFAKYTGTEIKHGGVDYLVLDANDILLRVVE
ncbi:MAG: co-chaperone GroES [Caldilineales bacterium]|nr:co-chaperone GroES [Caldilineales bacterium]MDW8316705.1 co-chaperone GroES [Anaerolineae bacterium]